MRSVAATLICASAFLVAASVQAASQSTHLIEALRQRLETAEAVARAKHNSGAPVEDKARERDVIFAAVHKGVNMGLNADKVKQVFEAQIEASKIAQRAFLKRWKDLPKFKNVPDLAKQVRPILDRLTPLILRGLKDHPSRWGVEIIKQGPKNPVYQQAWFEAIDPIINPDRGAR